jgi:biopolymer transport protein ExbB
MAAWLGEFTLVSYFARGGFWMYPLAICSLAGLTVILYKLHEFWRASTASDDLMLRVEGKLTAGDTDSALSLCEERAGPVALVIGAGLLARDRSRERTRQAGQEAGVRAVASLEGYLPTLSTVANIAPLLGFLGTVTGMIKAFAAVAAEGLGDPTTVAAGISEALITTATGLIIAIPCFAAYNYFVSRVNGFALQMEEASANVADLVAGGGAAGAP